jgi:hypothetical protein
MSQGRAKCPCASTIGALTTPTERGLNQNPSIPWHFCLYTGKIRFVLFINQKGMKIANPVRRNFELGVPRVLLQISAYAHERAVCWGGQSNNDGGKLTAR